MIAFPFALWEGGVLDHQLSFSINVALEQVNYLNAEMFGTQDPTIQIRPRHRVLHHARDF